MSERTVEDVYKKQTQHEHILTRPDTYIGSVELEKEVMWVLDPTSSIPRLIQRELTYSPALYRITDELINNAQDNKVRDSSMNEFRLDIDPEAGVISVYNNGQSIPTTIHKEYNIYVAELIFGNLLTSSNYDDTEKRVTGGRNGYGAKLTNIFSTEFIVETRDSERGLKYKQVFSNNMFTRSDPVITKSSGPSYTRITFKPDLKRFHMDSLDEDIVALLSRRVYDVAGTAGKGLKVFLNGERVPVTSFKQYCDMYFTPAPSALDSLSFGNGGAGAMTDEESDVEEETKSKAKKGKTKAKEDAAATTITVPRVYEQVSDRWEVLVAASDNGFQQVSFVNGINTLKGGTHVAAVTDQVAKAIVEHLSKKQKKVQVKPQHVKNHLFVMVNALIENPAFDTQTKVTLTTKRSAFGSDPTLSEAAIKRILKSGICDGVLSYAQFKQDKDLKKNDGKKKSGRVIGIPKLEDANEAGGRRARDCTLILTEGDSAKALAMAGLSVVGRDLYGVFPLRGKLLNVREATGAQIMENKEIGYLKQILGLKNGQKYTDTSSLRYGHVMIMTDQDHDGSHIKGLIINMFDTFWPELLQVPGFLTEFITPIVKVSKGPREVPFYTLPEYEEWRAQHAGGKGWRAKYYKGLGTSTAAEAKVYFANIDSHQVPFTYRDPRDSAMIELAFARNAVGKRKEWLAAYEPGTYLDHAQEQICYSDFINKELILFSIAANQRAIPCVVDGLKPGQRKVLFSCFKRNLTREMKVAQLAGYVAEQSAYHHGEASLAATIVNLAQNYVGANNINYLWPAGQFGTRAQGGKDAASARYIFTHLSPVTRALFPKDDDPLLTYLNDDGLSIEPDYYVPVLPTVLVNGTSGIGMGWSSEIPNYNPRDLIENLRRMIRGERPQHMHPWYKGFIGRCVAKGYSGSYTFQGLAERVSDDTVHVMELPVGVWTSDYKQWLEELASKGLVKEINEYHSDVTVSFGVVLSPEAVAELDRVGLVKYFKLERAMSTTNMVLFDSQGRLRRYDTPLQILEEFYGVRLQTYQRRKAHMCAELEHELMVLSAKARFVQGVVEDSIKIRNVKKKDVCVQLSKLGFPVVHKGKDAKKREEEDDEDVEEEEAEVDAGKGYDYLLSLPLWSLTWEKVQALLREKAGKEEELRVLRATEEADMWLRDLALVEQALDEHERKEEELLNAAENAKYGSKAKKTKAKRSDDTDDEWGMGNKTKARAGKTKDKGKERNIPQWALAPRPQAQEVVVEDEVVKKKRGGEKTLKEEADVLAALSSGDMNMLFGGEGEGDAEAVAVKVEAPAKKPRKPRVKKEKEVKDDKPTAKRGKAKQEAWDSDASESEGPIRGLFDADSEDDDNWDDALPKARKPRSTAAVPAAPKPAARTRAPAASPTLTYTPATPGSPGSPSGKKPRGRKPKATPTKEVKEEIDGDPYNFAPAVKLPKPTVAVVSAPAAPAAPVDLSTLSLRERMALKAGLGSGAGASLGIAPVSAASVATRPLSPPATPTFSQLERAASDDDVDALSQSFSEKMTLTPTPKKKPTKRKTKAADKAPSTPMSPAPKRGKARAKKDAEESDDAFSPSPKPRARGRGKRAVLDDSDEDALASAPVAKAVKAAAKAPAKAPARKTAARKVLPSDDEATASEDELVRPGQVLGGARAPRRAAAQARKYVFNDDEDTEDD